MKTAVVTGAASGIGLELTSHLLREGWAVAAVVRRFMPERGDFIGPLAEGRLKLYRGDLSDADARQTVVDALRAAEPCIDVLFNNAGTCTGIMQFSPQDRELQYEVNCIAPYAMAQGLANNLASAPNGRIVNTSSDAVFYARHFDPTTLAHPASFRKIIGPYAASKLALSLWTSTIAPTLPASVTAVSVTPGPTNTAQIRGPGMPRLMRMAARLTSKPPARGAALLWDAATSNHPPGSFLMKGRIRELPCTQRAAETLGIVAAAARAQ